MNRCKYLAIWIVALATSVSFISLTSFSQEKGSKAPKEGYVESETCKGCHPDLFEAFKKDTPHWKNLLDPKIAIDKKGCESCHGPGEKHAEAEGKGFIFSFKDQNARTRSEACLPCHQKNKSIFHFNRGTHKLSAVGCNDCHQIHGTGKTKKSLLKNKDPDLCFSCHQDVKAKFYLPNNHRVLQGAVKCSDCHSPHGSEKFSSLRKINKFNNDTCFSCHPEKRGPWVFEHGAQKFDGCSACHSPHGSQNRFLLNRREVRQLCMECHGQVHFPKFSCLNCHTQIHGSNFSSRFLQ